MWCNHQKLQHQHKNDCTQNNNFISYVSKLCFFVIGFVIGTSIGISVSYKQQQQPPPQQLLRSYNTHNEINSIFSPNFNLFSDTVSSKSVTILEEDIRQQRNHNNNKRVQVQLYEESLCIDCKKFVLNTLIPTYELLGPEIIDLSIVAFGNAKYVDNENELTTINDGVDNINNTNNKKTLICQHGKAECDSNIYELCVADIYEYNINRYLPFIQCLYTILPMGYNDTLLNINLYKNCAIQTAIEWITLYNCYNDTNRVQQLQYKAYTDTPKDHTYVPWIIINNQHWDDSISNNTFQQQICLEYNKKNNKNKNSDDHSACS